MKIKIPAGAASDLKVFWYDTSTGKLTDMNATQQNGYLVFTTNHFSYYVVAKSANPKTGDTGANAVVYYELFAVAAFGSIFLLNKYRRHKSRRQ